MAHAEALLAAAEEGVSLDGLRVTRVEDGYRFAVPGETHRGLAAEEVAQLADEHAAYVSNWHYWERVVGGQDTPRRAYLRWVERAPPEADGVETDGDTPDVPARYADLRAGATRTWGELAVGARLDDGERVYSVCHEDDADREGLDAYEDPEAARRLVKTTDGGRYRPLKTAPTLPTGWTFEGLDGEQLVRTVDYVYPATVANWHRERQGELDVTHFRECAERQTGIYDVVDELTPEQVGWLAEACCADSQCLKRREWDEDAETDLDVPRGEGAFPCREPCSLVVAAARTFTTLEGEESREYTFQLTPTEKNQLEGILEAVADGRVDEIREADLNDPANRYRARYLRAKRLEEGDLSGEPTFQED
jgi:hypothetical protein